MFTTVSKAVFFSLVSSSVLIFAACGGDSSDSDDSGSGDGGGSGDAKVKRFEGRYEVLSHTQITDGCEGEPQPVEGEEKGFRLKGGLGFFDGEKTKTLDYYPCDGSGKNCKRADTSMIFDEKTADGWYGEPSKGASGFGSTCWLTLNTVNAVREGDRVTIRKKRFTGQVEVEGECVSKDNDLGAMVAEHRDQLKCSRRETLVGKSL